MMKGVNRVLADNNNNINLQQLLEDFKSELEKQFNLIFSNKSIDKSIISTQLEKFRKTTFDNINKELENISKDQSNKSNINIKKILDQNKEKYINEFEVISQSFIKQSNIQQKQINSVNSTINMQQQLMDKEIENIKKIQIKAVKQIDGKSQALIESIDAMNQKKMKSTSTVNKSSRVTTSSDQKTKESPILKTIENILKSFETKAIKRQEAQDRTTKMIIQKQKKDPRVIDDDKQKEMQESAIAEHNEANLEQVESESDDTIADMKIDADKLENEHNDTDKKKKQYDFASEQGWTSWLVDTSVDVLKWSGMAIAAGGLEFWNWMTSEGKKVAEETSSIESDGDQISERLSKENLDLTEKELDSTKDSEEDNPSTSSLIDISEIERISKDIEAVNDNQQHSSGESPEDDPTKDQSIIQLDSIKSEMENDISPAESSTPSVTPGKLPSMGLSGSPQSEDDPLQKQAEQTVAIQTDSIEKNQKIVEENGTKELVSKSSDQTNDVDMKKQPSEMEDQLQDISKPSINVIDSQNNNESSPLSTKPSDIDQISFDGFNVNSLMSIDENAVGRNYQPSEIENDNDRSPSAKELLQKGSTNEEVIIHAKEVKLMGTDDDQKKMNKIDAYQQQNSPSKLKQENIQHQSSIVINNKLEKVNQELKQQENIKQSVKPMEKKSTIINEQTFLMDDFYGLLNEMTQTIDALSKTIEGQKK